MCLCLVAFCCALLCFAFLLINSILPQPSCLFQLENSWPISIYLGKQTLRGLGQCVMLTQGSLSPCIVGAHGSLGHVKFSASVPPVHLDAP